MPAHLLRRFSIAGLVLAIGIVGWVVLGYALEAPLDRDESMYVAAGVLARSGALYADVPFLQMPALPWIYAAFLPEPGTGPLLLVARMFTVACSVLVVVALIGIAHRRGLSPWIGLGFATLLAVHPTFLAASREATNHLPPLTAFACAAWILVGERRSRRACVGAGLLLGLAVALRLTWAPVAVVTWIAVGMMTGSRRDASYVALGGAIVALPVLVAASAAPEAFVFQNVGFHTVNREWAIESGRPWALGRSALFDALRESSTMQSVHGWLMATALAFALAIRRPRHVVAVALVATSLVLAGALPSPWWARHAVPVFGGFTVLAVVSFPRAVPFPRGVTLLLCFAVALGLTARGSRHVGAAEAVFDASTWTPLEFHRTSARWHTAPVEGPIATLRPLDALEAGLPITPASVAGPFVWRVRARLDDDARRAARGADMTIAPALRPPAVMLGVEPRYEGDTEARLRAAGYVPAAEGPGRTTLWIAP